MLYQIFAITIKELKLLMHDRAGMVTLFAMPIMFILIMSVALQNAFQVGSSDLPVTVLVVNQDQGELAAKAIADLREMEGIKPLESLDGKPLTRQAAEALIVKEEERVAILFPPDFSQAVTQTATDPQAAPAQVTFIVDPTTGNRFLGPIRGAVEGFVQRRAALAQAPLQMRSAFENLAAQASPQEAPFVRQVGTRFIDTMVQSGALAEHHGGVQFQEVVPAAFKVDRFPNSVEQSVPGYTIFGIFFIVAVLATSFLEEKQAGTFRRLLAAPLPQSALLLGKLLPYYLINIIQVVLMFGVGVLVFHMNLGHAPLALAAVTLSTGLAATGLGLLVAAIGKTPSQVSGVSTLLVLTLAALGGILVPAFVMPDFMQKLALITPHAWALDGYQDIIVRGLGLQAVLPNVAVLTGFAVLFFGFALWRFRFD
ncbi:MAG: ABC-2 transporter permease [Chloroflexi bacterium]|nr:ABC-2 transporter permease [Chloroflexota bacterium]